MLIQPGNEIEIKRKDNKDIVIGPGLKKSTQNSLIAIKCGQLKKRENCFYWIDSKQKRVNSNNNKLLRLNCFETEIFIKNIFLYE